MPVDFLLLVHLLFNCLLALFFLFVRSFTSFFCKYYCCFSTYLFLNFYSNSTVESNAVFNSRRGVLQDAVSTAEESIHSEMHKLHLLVSEAEEKLLGVSAVERD